MPKFLKTNPKRRRINMIYEQNINGHPVTYVIQHEHDIYPNREYYFVGVLPTRKQAEEYIEQHLNNNKVVYEFNMKTGKSCRLYYLMNQEKIKIHLISLFTEGDMKTKCEALDIYTPFEHQIDFDITRAISGI
jgi:hypothetical protein